jgi:hypothetical protein
VFAVGTAEVFLLIIPPYALKILIIFTFSDLDKYDLDMLQQTVKIDYNMALEMTSDILLLEFIHRIVVCAFEVCILHSEHLEHWHSLSPALTVSS